MSNDFEKEFKQEISHPKYKNSEGKTDVFNFSSGKMIVRTEYPDGAILLYELTESNTLIDSNYEIIEPEKNHLTLNLDVKNPHFKDVEQ